MDLLAASLALALSATGSCGLPPLAAERPFAPGEVLSYDVAVAGVVKGGTLQLAVEAPILGGAQIPLRARARNTSVFAKIRKVKGTGVSFVSARTLRPVRYRDDVDQDGVKRGTDTRLDSPGPTVRMAWAPGRSKVRRTRRGAAAASAPSGTTIKAASASRVTSSAAKRTNASGPNPFSATMNVTTSSSAATAASASAAAPAPRRTSALSLSPNDTVAKEYHGAIGAARGSRGRSRVRRAGS